MDAPDPRGPLTVPIPRPFTVAVPGQVLVDLRERLGRARWPDEAPGSGWRHGTDLAYLRELATYWLDRYDWSRHEAALRAATFTPDIQVSREDMTAEDYLALGGQQLTTYYERYRPFDRERTVAVERRVSFPLDETRKIWVRALSFPKKGDPRRAAMEAILRAGGRWEEVVELNVRARISLRRHQGREDA
ncbi:MAG: epoxide hydrolase N-terminal domain-containing protein [Candidatus Rokubacteria bacterium]|nr:epoxide hydrolase N-terminal domain-containing protein [Candidatus Rokubacteria bacterium]